MNSYDLRNLQEAYMEVVENQQLDEVLDTPQKTLPYAAKNAASAVRAFVIGDKETLSKRFKGAKRGMKKIEKRTQREQVDLYDLILSHLLDEGYAETPEAAEVMMVNMSEEWRESIMEARVDNSLRGQQKKAVRNNRTFGNTTSYSKSKATKERHNIHRAKRNLTKLRGDKSEESSASILNQSSRVHRSKNSGYNRDGSYNEQVDLYDLILSHLLDEGYAETIESAEVMMVNMSEEWRESICEELTGERRRRALEKGTPLADRVANSVEGQPYVRRNRSGDITMRTTIKGPTKRGGGGFKGQVKSPYDTHGSGNRTARRLGKEVRDTSDEI